jgi:hypothetical protein
VIGCHGQSIGTRLVDCKHYFQPRERFPLAFS